MNLPNHVSESVRRRNPHLFGLDPCEGQIPGKRSTRPLEPQRQAPKTNPRRHPGGPQIIVSLCVFSRAHHIDNDNIGFACKPIRDAIAEFLGLDDGSKSFRWQYSHHQTTGEAGVAVKIETK